MSTGDVDPSEPSGYRPSSPDGAAGERSQADSAPSQWQGPGEQPSYQPPGPGHPPPGQAYQPQGPGYPPPGGGYPPPGTTYPPPGPGYQQAPYQGGYHTPPSGGGLSPQDERTWAMAAHLSSIVGMIFGLSFIGPLVVMLVQGPKSALVRANAVESLNFNLSVLIYFIVSFILSFLLIGIPMLFAVGVGWLVFTIIATVKSSNGEPYRYPLTIRMVS